MTTLTLIRHGQASFGQANYDELSPLGQRQARLTGAHLARIGAEFDVWLAGDLQRQQHTGRLAAEATTAGGVPAVQVDPAFNEYDADGIFRAYLPMVLSEQPELGQRQRELFTDQRLFQRAFEGVTAKWLADTPHDAAPFESWDRFRTRVEDGLHRLHRDHDRDARLIAFTSGGPVAVAVASCLGLSPAQTVQLNWVVHNAAVTDLRSTRTGWRLMGFNNITHLRLENDPDVITLR